MGHGQKKVGDHGLKQVVGDSELLSALSVK